MVLYADVLFLIDFSMDVVSLYMTARFTHGRLSVPMISAAAAIGAAVSVIITVFSIGAYISTVCVCVTSIVMSRIAFGRGNKLQIFKRAAILWSAGLILGGVLTALTTIGTRFSYTSDTEMTRLSSKYIILGVTLAVIIFYVLGRTGSKKTVIVSYTVKGVNYTYEGLIDSGNLLRDPFSGDPVIVMSYSAAPNILKKATEITDNPETVIDVPILPIPAVSIGGTSIVFGIRPESVMVGGAKKRALVVCVGKKADHNIPDCIVPEALLN